MTRVLLGALALAACNPNTVRAKGGAPFQLGGVRSALWMESAYYTSDDGMDSATLILTSADYGCGMFEEELNGETDEADSILWKSEGVMAAFTWRNGDGDDAGWEGSYYQGFYIGYTYEDVTHRQLMTMAFTDATTWFSYYSELGRGDVTDHSGDTVTGEIDTETFHANFEAENCGRLEPLDARDTGDSG